MKADGRGIGVLTRRALKLVERGVEPFEAGRRALAEAPQSAAGNGAVMRCVPVALRFHDNPDRLIRVATQQAAITHADGRCLWGAAAVCLAARELLHGNIYFVDEVVHRLADRVPKTLLDALHRVPRERQDDLPITVPGEFGYVVHCVEIAFWFATHDRTIEDSLTYLANAGGDTDTNAAVAGALLGARYGESGIPPRWIMLIAGADRVRQLADGLIGAAEPAP